MLQKLSLHAFSVKNGDSVHLALHNAVSRDVNKWLHLGGRRRTKFQLTELPFDLFVAPVPIKFISKFTK